VGPGQVWQTSTPPMPAGRAAAIALADQPILALAGAIDLSPSGNVSDRQLRYRGMNFSFDCPAVTGTDFAWYPATPVAGLPLTLMASSAPESHQPVSYRWQVGNSLPIAGQLIRRVFFMEPGTYTVTVTASNCLDFHQERRSRALTVVPAPGRAYLPLLFKGHK